MATEFRRPLVMENITAYVRLLEMLLDLLEEDTIRILDPRQPFEFKIYLSHRCSSPPAISGSLDEDYEIDLLRIGTSSHIRCSGSGKARLNSFTVFIPFAVGQAEASALQAHDSSSQLNYDADFALRMPSFGPRLIFGATYPSIRTARSTRIFFSGWTYSNSLITRETVVFETPANLAISTILMNTLLRRRAPFLVYMRCLNQPQALAIGTGPTSRPSTPPVPFWVGVVILLVIVKEVAIQTRNNLKRGSPQPHSVASAAGRSLSYHVVPCPIQ